MGEAKRGRGRPKGASRHADADWTLLAQVADEMERDPSLKATTAIRALGVLDDAAVRRLQRRWKAEGARLLKEPRRESEAAPRAPVEPAVEQAMAEAVTAVIERPVEHVANPAPDRPEPAAPACQPFDPFGVAFNEWRRATEAAYRTLSRNIDAALAVQRSFQDFWIKR